MKRVFDIVVSAAALLLLSPLLLVLAVVLYLNIGRPVLFSQERVGRGNRVFRMIKFRTMTDERDSAGLLLPDLQRITGMGRLLRESSLDELPELINILRGDMSLVGPRPLLVRYLPRYSSAQARRHLVRPGLTGLAQVSGRNALDWDSKLALDVEYVDTRSWRLDLSILMRTAAQIVRRTGINSSEGETMPEFMGAAQADHGDRPAAPSSETIDRQIMRPK